MMVSRVFKWFFCGNLKSLSRVQESCEGVLRLSCFSKFIIACHSLQLPEQKEGLFKYQYLSIFLRYGPDFACDHSFYRFQNNF